MPRNLHRKFLLTILFLTSGCTVGPEYIKVTAEVPDYYKETKNSVWKIAEPLDQTSKGKWWEIYNDPYLNELVAQIETNNYGIAAQVAQLEQAHALLSQSKSNYFPTVGTQIGVTRQQQNSSANQSNIVTNYNLSLNASWIPDFWGGIRRTVQANEASVQATKAQLENLKLTTQATFIQYYFQIRFTDKNDLLLNEIADCYKEQLEVSEKSRELGLINQIDLQKIESQYELAKINIETNKITREQYEHALAIILGKSPAEFSLEIQNNHILIPQIPILLPSTLIERRPDIAQAERLVAQANAQIGIAKSAYFPTFNLSSSAGYLNSEIKNLFTLPALIWSIGANLSETLFDAGSRKYKVKAAEENYKTLVNQYKQTVLQALQNVEDNLSAYNHLKSAEDFHYNSYNKIQNIYYLYNEKFKEGLINRNDLILAKINLLSAEKNLNEINKQRAINSLDLITALGGGWNQNKEKKNDN